MPLDHWLAFAVASAIMLVIPGPTVLLVVSYALAHGRKPAAVIAAGVALGDFVAMTSSMIGLGAVLSASAAMFGVLRWIGAAYLIYLGVKLWRAPVVAVAGAVPATRLSRMFGHAFAVTVFNPKAIIFFVAFVPQFIEASRPFWPQVAVLEATFILMAALNALGYASLAAVARRSLRAPRVQRAVNRTGGSLLIGAGLLAVGWRKASA